MVRTSGFHPDNRGSIPLGDESLDRLRYCFDGCCPVSACWYYLIVNVYHCDDECSVFSLIPAKSFVSFHPFKNSITPLATFSFSISH